MRPCCVQIREILQTDLNSRGSIEGLSGSGDPETFFDAEDNPTNGSAEMPANPDESGTITTLGDPCPRPSFLYLCTDWRCTRAAYLQCI